MNSYVYPAPIIPAEEGGWLIRFRDFSEGHSQAEAGQDVIDIAEGCLQACIEGRLEDAMAIPEPSEAKAGEVLVTVPIETATKAALFQTVAASGADSPWRRRSTSTRRKFAACSIRGIPRSCRASSRC